MMRESVTTRVGVNAEKSSHKYREERPIKFHFLRLRSKPSTFRAVGFPTSRGIQAIGPLATLQMKTTSALVKQTWVRERNVWKAVSKCLLEIVGRMTRRTPGATTSSGFVNGRRQYTVTSWPRAARRAESCSASVSKPP